MLKLMKKLFFIKKHCPNLTHDIMAYYILTMYTLYLYIVYIQYE